MNNYNNIYNRNIKIKDKEAHESKNKISVRDTGWRHNTTKLILFHRRYVLQKLAEFLAYQSKLFTKEMNWIEEELRGEYRICTGTLCDSVFWSITIEYKCK